MTIKELALKCNTSDINRVRNKVLQYYNGIQNVVMDNVGNWIIPEQDGEKIARMFNQTKRGTGTRKTYRKKAKPKPSDTELAAPDGSESGGSAAGMIETDVESDAPFSANDLAEFILSRGWKEVKPRAGKVGTDKDEVAPKRMFRKRGLNGSTTSIEIPNPCNSSKFCLALSTLLCAERQDKRPHDVEVKDSKVMAMAAQNQQLRQENAAMSAQQELDAEEIARLTATQNNTSQRVQSMSSVIES